MIFNQEVKELTMFFKYRFLLIMKLVTLFFLINMSAVLAEGFAQSITLKANNISLIQAMKSIEKQSGHAFFLYGKDLADLKVNANIENLSLDKAMHKLLIDQPAKWLLEDGTIVVKPVTHSGEVIKNVVKAEDSPPHWQQRTITGTVTDISGNFLEGVTVAIKGTKALTVTDNNGKYSLTVSGTGHTLLFSMLGYVPAERILDRTNSLNIALQQQIDNLDEVVVVGYGTQKKREITGAVSSIKFDDTPVNTFSTISQALAGKAAGLQAVTVSAQPGGKTSFNVRGATSTGAGNDPLIVIDGFPVSFSDEPSSGNRYNSGPKDNILATLNPNDIESIVVLKDASSTAIYGARAGHGVILVTTKRGKEGRVKIDYGGSFSNQVISTRVETLQASDWMRQYNRYNRERFLFDNRMGLYSVGGNSKPIDWSSFGGDRFSENEILNPKHDTDWVGAISRTGMQQQHSLTMNGGTEKTKYVASLGYFDQDGVLRNSSMNRFNGRINLDQKISDIFTTGFNLTFNKNSFSNIPLGNGEFEYAGVLTTAIQSEPIRPIFDQNGKYSTNLYADYLPNAVSMLEISDDSKLERLLTNAFLEATPLEGLRLKLMTGVDRDINSRKTYLPKTTLYGLKSNGEASITNSGKTDYLIELTADYRKQFGQHNLNMLGGYSFQEFNWDNLNAGNQNFLIDGFLYNNLAAGAFQKPIVGSAAGKSQMASFFWRVNYNFDARFFLTSTLRADGASNLAKGHQWGYFPSVSVAWDLSNETFFKSLKETVSQLKIRASYGQTGNSNIGNKARDLFYVGRNYLFGGLESKGVYLGQMGNQNLTWETTSEFNFGLDVELAKRINLTLEYYNRTISDLLSTMSLMSYYEVNSIAANIGKTSSKGFELTLNTQNLQKEDFSWTSDLTFSLYRDRWKERNTTWKPAVYEQTNDYIRAQFGYLSDGLVQPTESGQIAHMPGVVAGQVKLKDLDGFMRDGDGKVLYDAFGKALKTGQPDGRLDDADKVFLGTTDPGYLFGFNNVFRFRQFDLNFYLYGVFDQLKAGDYRTAVGPERITTDYGMPSSLIDFWSSDNPNEKYVGLFQSQSPFGTGDYLMKKIWFARMRNITVGYNFTPKNNKKLFERMRVYFDINNPFIITNYKGLDPETDSWAGGIYAYPNARSYSLGVNITF